MFRYGSKPGMWNMGGNLVLQFIFDHFELVKYPQAKLIKYV